MLFTTETGSIYEVDTDAKRIRRLSGNKRPTARVGDGWKNYTSLCPEPIEIDKSVLIIWGSDVALLNDTPKNSKAVPTTLTSLVVSIEP